MTGSYYTHKETGIRKLHEERLPQNVKETPKNDQTQANYYSFVVAWQMFNDFEKPDVSKSGKKKDKVF